MKYYKIFLEKKLRNDLPVEDLFADRRQSKLRSLVRLIPRDLHNLNSGLELTLKSPVIKLVATATFGLTVVSGGSEARAYEGFALNNIDNVKIYETCTPSRAVGVVGDIPLGSCNAGDRIEEEYNIIAGQHSNSYQHTNTTPSSHNNAGWANHSNSGGNHSNSDWTNHCNTKIDGTSHVNMMHGDFLF